MHIKDPRWWVVVYDGVSIPCLHTKKIPVRNSLHNAHFIVLFSFTRSRNTIGGGKLFSFVVIFNDLKRWKMFGVSESEKGYARRMSHEIPPCHHVVGEEILLFPLFIVLILSSWVAAGCHSLHGFPASTEPPNELILLTALLPEC